MKPPETVNTAHFDRWYQANVVPCWRCAALAWIIQAGRSNLVNWLGWRLFRAGLLNGWYYGYCRTHLDAAWEHAALDIAHEA